MQAVLDGRISFGHRKLDEGTVKRARVQNGINSVDGVVNIDLGKRGRLIKHQGVVHGPSVDTVRDKVYELSALIDGEVHSLKVPDGRVYENLLVRSVMARRPGVSGSIAACRVEIEYEQLEA